MLSIEVVYCKEEADQQIALYAVLNNRQSQSRSGKDLFYVYGRDSDYLAMGAPYIGKRV